MAWTLTNYYTQDTYSSAGQLQVKGARYSLSVANSSIYYQYQRDQGLQVEPWQSEVFLAPGFYLIRRKITGLQVRSAVTGLPALVTVEIVPYGE